MPKLHQENDHTTTAARQHEIEGAVSDSQPLKLEVEACVVLQKLFPEKANDLLTSVMTASEAQSVELWEAKAAVLLSLHTYLHVLDRKDKPSLVPFATREVHRGEGDVAPEAADDWHLTPEEIETLSGREIIMLYAVLLMATPVADLPVQVASPDRTEVYDDEFVSSLLPDGYRRGYIPLVFLETLSFWNMSPPLEEKLKSENEDFGNSWQDWANEIPSYVVAKELYADLSAQAQQTLVELYIALGDPGHRRANTTNPFSRSESVRSLLLQLQTELSRETLFDLFNAIRKYASGISSVYSVAHSKNLFYNHRFKNATTRYSSALIKLVHGIEGDVERFFDPGISDYYELLFKEELAREETKSRMYFYVADHEGNVLVMRSDKGICLLPTEGIRPEEISHPAATVDKTIASHLRRWGIVAKHLRFDKQETSGRVSMLVQVQLTKEQAAQVRIPPEKTRVVQCGFVSPEMIGYVLNAQPITGGDAYASDEITKLRLHTYGNLFRENAEQTETEPVLVEARQSSRWETLEVDLDSTEFVVRPDDRIIFRSFGKTPWDDLFGMIDVDDLSTFPTYGVIAETTSEMGGTTSLRSQLDAISEVIFGGRVGGVEAYQDQRSGHR